MDDFLRNTELLDSFVQEAPIVIPNANQNNQQAIGFKDATFSWSLEGSASLIPSEPHRDFRLRINGELTFKPDCINVIIGPTYVKYFLITIRLNNSPCLRQCFRENVYVDGIAWFISIT